MNLLKMKEMMKEIYDLIRFIFTSGNKKDIVFYAEHAGYYPHFEGVVSRLTDHHKKEISYITSSRTDPILKSKHPLIRVFYINALLPYFMLFVHAKVFVMTLTDLNQFHLRRSVFDVHYVYIFHSLISTHMSYREGAFDHYDTIFCSGPHHYKEIRAREKLKGLPPKNLVKTGYYRLEQVYKKYKEFREKSAEHGKKTILVAPSWGKKNILELCGRQLTNILLEAGCKVVVRPHPEIIRRTPQIISALNEKFGSNEDFYLETSTAGSNSLLEADVLISDMSGVAFEYALGTERPVLSINVPWKIGNENYKEIGVEPMEAAIRPKIGVVIEPEDMADVKNALSKLIVEKDNYTQAIRELRENVVYNFSKSAEIEAESIIDIISKR